MTFACIRIGQSRAAYLQFSIVNRSTAFGDVGWENPTINTNFAGAPTPTGYPFHYPGGRIEGVLTPNGASGTIMLVVTEDPISANPPIGFNFEKLVIANVDGRSVGTYLRSAATAATSGYTRTFSWAATSLFPSAIMDYTLIG